VNAEVDEDEEDEDEFDYYYELDDIEFGCNKCGGIIEDEYELLLPGATGPILSSIDPGILISSLIAVLFPSFLF
jgi:hypothetical protein